VAVSNAAPREKNSAASADLDGLRAGERKLLAIAAQVFWHRQWGPITRDELATLAGMASSGGTFARYVSTLSSRGLIVVERGGSITLTQKGQVAVSVLNIEELELTCESIVRTWASSLRAGERAMLEHLVLINPKTCTRKELGAAVSIEHTGGTFNRYLSTLRARGLADVDRDQVSAGAALYWYRVQGSSRAVRQ
jgi:predicted transcriptional regulator